MSSTYSECFLEEWVINVLIPMMNKELSKKMNLQDFNVFLGCIFFMACYDGVPNREMWWSTKPIGIFGGAPFQLNAYMSRSRFDQIMHALQYTDTEVSFFFLDRFHKVCQIIDAFNDHYSKGYKPSWLLCINESSMNSVL
jgi:hypothetical protein